MERAVAIKTLAKLVGKKLGYRVDPKAPTQEERNAARIEMTSAVEKRKRLAALRDAREKAVLEADAEYQKLREEAKVASEKVKSLTSIAHHYKITVGTTDSMFFHVTAQGDSWEQVIDMLENKGDKTGTLYPEAA